MFLLKHFAVNVPAALNGSPKSDPFIILIRWKSCCYDQLYQEEKKEIHSPESVFVFSSVCHSSKRNISGGSIDILQKKRVWKIGSCAANDAWTVIVPFSISSLIRDWVMSFVV